MCGIVGYTGGSQALPILLEGLGRLEYRGYDSAGVSVSGPDGIITVKAEGRLDNLRARLKTPLQGCCGLGHTRWATHGAPTDANAHPHHNNRVYMIHNGIIENYLELKEFLSGHGYGFVSETDTEVAAALIDFHYHGDPFEAIRDSLAEIEGAFAFGLMFADRPGEIYAVRKAGPLIVAVGEGENFIASDITAVIGHTKSFFTLDEQEIAVITREEAKVFDLARNPVEKTLLQVNWNVEQAQKEGFPHYMLKEITEQPAAIRNTLAPRLRKGRASFSFDGIPEGFFRDVDRIHIVACGTAMHAGLVGKSVIEGLGGIPVEVDIASEFRYRDPILHSRDLVVIISQSGETADSLAALRLAKERKIPTVAIVNVAGSSIAREADYVIHTHAGPEISVASTKAYTVQLVILYLMALVIGEQKNVLPSGRAAELTQSLQRVSEAVEAQISQSGDIARAAKSLSQAEHVFFIGRGLDYALACEASLKLKEISYIHSEAYAAGELKHGTISLITPGVPVVSLCSQKALAPKLISNIKEVRARGAYTIALAPAGHLPANEDFCNILIGLEALPDLLMPFTVAVAVQLLAYHAAAFRGCDIDKPRNLAKSVTVE